MAHFVWVGGFTAYTGAGSGFSAGGGTGPFNGTWFSVVSGATSTQGDIFFAPYAWNFTQNWRQRLTVTGGAFTYIPTTRLPRGSDSVQFGIVTSPSGPTIAYGISCLYGGLSGDGITNGSLTAWSGATGAASVGAITVSVSKFLRNIPNPMDFETGRIGVAAVNATSYGDFTNFKPIRVLTTSVAVNTDSSIAVTDANAPIVAIDNRYSAAASNLFVGTNNFSTAGQVYAKGTFNNVNQQSGSVYMTEATVSNMIVSGSIRNSAIDAASTCVNYLQLPCRLEGTILVGCSIGEGGGTETVSFNKYIESSPSAIIKVGQINTGTTPTYPVMKVGANGMSITGPNGEIATGPNIRLSTAQINKIEMDAGRITVDPDCTIYDYPIIRDGYINGGCTLDMNHPSNAAWGGFIIGLSPSDQGLRVDSETAVIKFIPGQSFKTAFEGVSLTG